MKLYLKTYIKKYIKFLPYYLFGSGTAFIIDLIVFTIFRGIFGPTISAIIAFTFGTFTLFTVLSTFLRGKFKRKRYGMLIQLLIGLVTLLINILVLNMIDFLCLRINYEFFIIHLDKSYFYAFLSKLIASCLGFFWTSVMTRKFLFVGN